MENENEEVSAVLVQTEKEIEMENEIRDDVLADPPNYDPASAKRDRKDALPSANVDPAPVEERPQALTAVTPVHQSRDQYSVESIVAEAPEGAIMKCRDESDVYAVQTVAMEAGKELKASWRPHQSVRLLWRIPAD